MKQVAIFFLVAAQGLFLVSYPGAADVTELPDSGTHLTEGPISVSWVSRLNGRAMHNDEAHASSLSPDGKVLYVTGIMATSELQPSNFDPTSDAVTVATDTGTGKILWTSAVDFGRFDDPRFMLLSRDGRTIFIAGRAIKGSGREEGMALVVFALDAQTGGPRWESQIDTTSRFEQPSGMELSNNEEMIFIIGRTSNERNFDYLTLAVDSVTGKVIWRETFNGESDRNDTAVSLVLSPQEDMVFVTGSSRRTTPTALRSDIVTIAYDAETGNRIWEKQFSRTGTSNEGSHGVVMGQGGQSILVVGASSDPESHGGPEILILTYDAMSGALGQVTSHGRGLRTKGISRVILGDDGRHLFLATSVSLNGGDFLVLDIDVKTGKELWRQIWDRGLGGEDVLFQMASDQSGRTLVLTGASNDSNRFPGRFNIVAMGLDARTGTRLWQTIYDGPGDSDDWPFSISLSHNSRRLYISGYSEGIVGITGRKRDYITISYDLPPARRH